MYSAGPRVVTMRLCLQCLPLSLFACNLGECNHHTYLVTGRPPVLSRQTSQTALESCKNEVGLLPGLFNALEICHHNTSFGTIQ